MKFNVLIVEDDPMVSSINRQYLIKIVPATKLNITETNNATSALKICQKHQPDLLLLDIYLPKISGTELLHSLSEYGFHPAVIILTAANDVEHVTQALNYGIIDYLIKPFSFARFKIAIKRFLTANKTLINDQKISQNDLDNLFNINIQDNSNKSELPKGLSLFSLNRVKQAIKEAPTPFSNQDIARISKLSRISTKKYLDFLEEKNWITSSVHYLKVGRPVKVYKSNKK